MESTGQPPSEPSADLTNGVSNRASVFRAFGRGLSYYVRGVIRLFNEKQILLCSQAVAFKALVTFVPIAVLALGFAGRVLARDQTFEIMRDFVTGYFPSYDAERLIEFANQLEQISVTLTIIGSLGMVFVAITLFSTLRTVLAVVFRDDWHQHRNRFRGMLFDARLVAQVGILFVLTVALTTVVHSLDTIWLSAMQRFGSQPRWLQSGWLEVVRYLSWFAPLLLSIGMFYQLYRFVPIPRPPRKSVLAGAVFAAVLWEIGKSIFTRYATGVGRINAWLPAIDNERILVIGDAFAIVVSFVMWAYFSGLILML
ncbi:MAG: YihY/virulence factor BrkB family protein, partial [Rhodothermales bacterium]|nr:YihY/virulence factor BrkB family protein [Rhodothermales bacterium]